MIAPFEVQTQHYSDRRGKGLEMPRNRGGGARGVPRGNLYGGEQQSPKSRRVKGNIEKHYQISNSQPQSCSPPDRLAETAISRFSLPEEARNTEHTHPASLNPALRHTQVNSVKADVIVTERREDTRDESFVTRCDDFQSALIVSQQSMTNINLDKAPLDDLQSKERNDLDGSYINHARNSGIDLSNCSSSFILDIQSSSKAVKTGVQDPAVHRPISPNGSDSSEEVILFRGRDSSHQRYGGPVMRDLGFQRTSSKAASSSDFTAQSSAIDNTPIPMNLDPLLQPIKYSRMTRTSHSFLRSTKTKTKAPLTPRLQNQTSKAYDDEMLTDYVQNIHEYGVLSQDKPFASLRVAHGDSRIMEFWSDRNGLPPLRVDTLLPLGSTLDGVNDRTTEESNSSSETISTVERILSKRDGPCGIQYLTILHGSRSDVAEWIPLSSLNIPGASEAISLFEDDTLANQTISDSTSVDSSFDAGYEIARAPKEDMDDLRDVEDLVKKRLARMTDAQTASRLLKQEEVGLGSAKVVLFGAEDGEESTPELLREQGIRLSASSKRKKGRRDPNPAQLAHFEDALDPYIGGKFDGTGQVQSEPHKKTKSDHDVPPFNTSDSELEASMILAWGNNRSKKKQRKQKREELRAQGLLGKGNAVDMNAKYSKGITVNRVIDEIRDFLRADNESLSLPPMDKAARKLVHEVANAFNLKSKSVGGKVRHPNLYKTSRTLPYNQRIVAMVQARLSHRCFLPHQVENSRGCTNRPGNARGGGGASTAVSYRDGEVVGAAAPELGVENKGRAMLERMGWSSGTALGALNNKGIMQPVAHTVKTTKAGLG